METCATVNTTFTVCLCVAVMVMMTMLLDVTQEFWKWYNNGLLARGKSQVVFN